MAVKTLDDITKDDLYNFFQSLFRANQDKGGKNSI